MKAQSKIEDHVVISEVSREDICLLAYKMQTVDGVGELLASFSYSSEEDLLSKAEVAVKKIDWKGWVEGKTTFRVSGTTRDTPVAREETAAEVGGFILDQDKQLQVKLENPDLNILLLVTAKKAYLAVDYAGRDLHKRDYKIFPNPSSLRGTIAAGLLRIAEWKTKEVLLDPFAQSGEVCIEAALLQTNTSVNYYSKEKFAFKKLNPLKLDWNEWFITQDKKVEVAKPNIYCFDAKMPNLTAAKKNAKIAGINKAIQFSRFDIEWLDTKLEKGFVDKIITHPPEPNKFSRIKDLEKLYKELFYQAEYILKKKGTLTLVQKNPELVLKAAKEKGFAVILQQEVFSGKSPLQVCVYQKK